MKELSRRVRQVLPDIFVAYPHAKLEVTPSGLTLRPVSGRGAAPVHGDSSWSVDLWAW